MAAFIAIALSAACAFFVYAMAQFGREIGLLRSQRTQSTTMIVPFRSVPESREGADRGGKNDVAVLPVGGMARRGVA
jgi:hypothetical protein